MSIIIFFSPKLNSSIILTLWPCLWNFRETHNTLKAIPISQTWKLRPRVVQRSVQRREAGKEECLVSGQIQVCASCLHGSSNPVFMPATQGSGVFFLYFIDKGKEASDRANVEYSSDAHFITSCWFHHGSCWLPNPQYLPPDTYSVLSARAPMFFLKMFSA